MDDVTARFLEKVDEIKAEKPTYKLGGDGRKDRKSVV